MTDIFLYTGEASPKDIRLRDPTGLSATFNLVGVVATGGVGSFTPEIDFALAGVTGTGAVGAFVPTIAFALSGVGGTGLAGLFSMADDFALSGVSAFGTAGSFAPQIAVALGRVHGMMHRDSPSAPGQDIRQPDLI